MNIVLYSHTFLPAVGGRELVVHFLADALQRKGVRVRVTGPSGVRSAAGLILPYPVHRYPQFVRVGSIEDKGLSPWRRWLLERSFVWRLRYDLARHGADLVHAHTTYPDGFTANLVLRHKIPLVITPHGIDIHEIPEIGHGLALIPGVREKITEALNAADAVTAISESIAEAVRRRGVSDERIIRIDNGVDLHRFDRRDTRRVRERYGIPQDAPIVLSVGNFTPRKGQDYLVRAARRLREAVPGTRVVIVGRGTGALREEVQRLGLAGTVLLPGSLPPPALSALSGGCGDDDLADLYREASVFVSCGIAEGSEGLSLAVLEAMAAGCPIVATDISGNRDIVQPGINGLLVAPASEDALARALLEVLRNPALRGRFSREARATAEKHGWDRVADDYIALYERLLTRRRKRDTA